MSSHVVVIGGGVVGAAAAYQLAREHMSVTLVDAQHEGHATAAGAGIVAPGCSYHPLTENYRLSYKAAAYYPTLLALLAEDGERDTGYEVVGSLFVAMNEEEVARLAIIERLFRERAEAGVPTMGVVSRLTGDEAKQLFPALGEVLSAVHTAGAARLDGRRLRIALTQAAEKRGARVVHGTAKLVCEGGAVKGVDVNSQLIAADAVIVAAGAWSNDFKQATGLEIPVKPQKGQIMHLEMEEHTGKWPIVEGFYSHYILTFPDHRVVAGATRETDSGYDTRVTAGGMQEVTEQALRVAPGLANGTMVEVRVGLRPDTPDKLPILGQVEGIDGLYMATGHGANGLTAGAYSGVAVANQVMGRPLDVDLQPFSLTRFL